MTDYEGIKKDFQKTVKEIREDIKKSCDQPKLEYPKAMMTGQQIRKGTATINCGGEWRSSAFSRTLSSRVFEHKLLKEFCKRNNAEACVEEIKIGQFPAFQIRLRFAE